MSKLERSLLDLVVKDLSITNLEELLEVMPKQSSGSRTKLWEYIPSNLVGEHIHHIPYTGAMTLLKKVGRVKLEEFRKTILDNNYDYLDIDQLRNQTLHPMGLGNIEKVLGVDPNTIPYISRRELKRWESIKVGRDLFIPGMGSFNITEATNVLGSIGGSRYSPSFSVSNLQAIGYLGDIEHKVIIDDKDLMKHIVRHWATWKETNHGHAYDIIKALGSGLAEAVSSGLYLEWNPERLYREADEANRRQTALLNKARNADLNTPFKKVILPRDNTLDIQMIANHRELIAVGELFNNCVGSSYYAGKGVAGASCFFIITLENAIYLCDLSLISGRVEQLKGRRNGNAPFGLKQELVELGKKIIKLNK